VSNIAGNRFFRDLLVRATTSLKEGKRISPRLAEENLFPDLAVELLAIGEESGRIGAMCGKIADRYEQELKNRIKRAMALIEPVFILAIALVAGFVVLTMLSVILGMNEISG